MVEIHGTIREVMCLDCGERAPMERALARVRAGEEDPPVPELRRHPQVGDDLLRPGARARGPRARRAGGRATCDLLLAVGSTLSVYPIAGVVPIAKRAGARVVILNAEPTEMDELADAVLRGSIGELLPSVVGPRSHTQPE